MAKIYYDPDKDELIPIKKKKKVSTDLDSDCDCEYKPKCYVDEDNAFETACFLIGLHAGLRFGK